MKKILLLPVSLVCMAIAVQAQKKKVPPPPPPEPPKVEMVRFTPPVIVKDEEEHGFFTRNPSVADLTLREVRIANVVLKDGTKEEYNLSNEVERKAFIEKYGEAPPPPPPPLPPAKPKKPAPPKVVKQS